jgi:hypothetical protein
MSDPQIVMTLPDLAKSAIEKYPAEYGITLVGELVTSMKAWEETSADGKAMDRTGSPSDMDSSIMIGIMIVAVTVLLENIIFSNEMIKTIANIMGNVGKEPIRDNNTMDNHRAVPVP